MQILSYYSISIFIVILLIIALIWFYSLKARERALAIAYKVCDKWNCILVDETVSLDKYRLILKRKGLEVYREYIFEYSYEGTQRFQGVLCFSGNNHTQTITSSYSHSPLNEKKSNANTGNNIINFDDYN